MGEGEDAGKLEELLRQAGDIAALPAVSDARAAEFLGEFSPEQLERALALAAARSSGALEAACSCLSKVLAGAFGARLLPQLEARVRGMLTASSSPVRCLGCELLGRLAQGESFAPTGLRAGASAALLGAMRDPCTSVSAAAARGLRAAAGSEGGLGLVVVPELGELCRSNSSAAFRLRGLQLAVDIAALSEEAAASVASLGALNALVEGLRGREKDELGWLAAVEVAVDLARGNPLGAAAVLGPLGEQMLGAGTLGLGARALGALAEVSASAAAHPGGWAAAAAVSTGEGGNSLLEGVLGCFGRALSAGDPTEKEAALGALAGFGATSAGSELLLGCPAGEPLVRAAAHAALHRDAHAPARLASLHAMAALAGAERVAFGGRIDLTGGPLGEAAEKHLRRAVYEAAAGDASPCTPAEALHRLVAQPLTEARVAAYRFVSALAARPWGAQEVLSNAGLFEDLLGRSRLDSAREACEWRHTCVAVLCAQLEAGGLPRAAGALPQLQEALAAGPYVAGGTVAAGVAVGSRGAGGG